jgi:hypothetical protein
MSSTSRPPYIIKERLYNDIRDKLTSNPNDPSAQQERPWKEKRKRQEQTQREDDMDDVSDDQEKTIKTIQRQQRKMLVPWRDDNYPSNIQNQFFQDTQSPILGVTTQVLYLFSFRSGINDPMKFYALDTWSGPFYTPDATYQPIMFINAPSSTWCFTRFIQLPVKHREYASGRLIGGGCTITCTQGANFNVAVQFAAASLSTYSNSTTQLSYDNIGSYAPLPKDYATALSPQGLQLNFAADASHHMKQSIYHASSSGLSFVHGQQQPKTHVSNQPVQIQLAFTTAANGTPLVLTPYAQFLQTGQFAPNPAVVQNTATAYNVFQLDLEYGMHPLETPKMSVKIICLSSGARIRYQSLYLGCSTPSGGSLSVVTYSSSCTITMQAGDEQWLEIPMLPNNANVAMWIGACLVATSQGSGPNMIDPFVIISTKLEWCPDEIQPTSAIIAVIGASTDSTWTLKGSLTTEIRQTPIEDNNAYATSAQFTKMVAPSVDYTNLSNTGNGESLRVQSVDGNTVSGHF